jgi:hypothetical protein
VVWVQFDDPDRTSATRRFTVEGGAADGGGSPGSGGGGGTDDPDPEPSP